MKLARLSFLLRRDLTTFVRLKWRIAEMLYFPVTTILIWGFFAVAHRELGFGTALAVLAVNVFWNFAYISQSTANMQINEDIWSGSLRQILLTGVTGAEYIAARIAFSIILALPLGALLFLLARSFGLTVSGMHSEAAWAVLITSVSSVGLALLVAASILTFGKEYGFLAWTALQAFVLLSAPFNEPEDFPRALEIVSRAMPYTDAFAIARSVAVGRPVALAAIVRGLAVGISYAAVSVPVYLAAFGRARRTGMLAKL
jgi:hypothetical protein